MPRFNRENSSLLYLGEGAGDGSVVPVNGRPFFGPSAGKAVWLNGDSFLCQYYTGAVSPRMVLVDRNAQKTDILIDGINDIIAGYGNYFVYAINSGLTLNGKPTSSYYVAFGPENSSAYTEYPSHVGLWFNGIKISSEVCSDITILSKSEIVFSDKNGSYYYKLGKVTNLFTCDTRNNYGWLVPYWWNNNLWIAYQWFTVDAIVTHPYDNPNGYELGSGNCFGLDAHFYDKPYFVWSISEAYQANDLRLTSELGSKFDLRDLLSDNGGDMSDLDSRVTALEGQVTTLNNQVKTLNTRVDSLEIDYRNLASRVTNLEHSSNNSPSNLNGAVIALKSSRNKFMRDNWDDNLAYFDRDEPGEGEFYTIQTKGNSNPNPPNSEILSPLTAEGKFFYRDGQIVRVKRFSSFKLLNLFENNQNIDSILEQMQGYNSVRVFCYTPKKDWGAEAWEWPDKIVTAEFCQFMSEWGFDIELTLITDDDRARIDQARELVEYLSVNPPSNLTLEAVNEPFIHNKLDPNELKNILSNSPFLYSSGVYTDNTKFYGKFWNDHSPRDAEWWRKGGHNLLEAWNGGGPNSPNEPALRMPGVEDEPIKPNEAGFRSLDFYQYSASCGLMGAGATFHYESGKFSRLLTPQEFDCAEGFLNGLNVYPLDAANGQYRRIVEPGNEQGGPTEYARTYVVGNYAIRIHQNGTSFPESGWSPLDEHGICWVKG